MCSQGYASPTPGPPRRAPAIRMPTPAHKADDVKAKDAEDEKKPTKNDAENEKEQMKDAENEKKQPPKRKQPTKKDPENEKKQPMKDTENEEQPTKGTEKEKEPPKKKQKKKQSKKDAGNEKEQPQAKKQKQDAGNEKEQPIEDAKTEKKKQTKDAETEKKPSTKDTEKEKDQPTKDKPEKKVKPIQDMDLGVVRVRYTTQGSKSPIVKLEVREDRFRPTSAWVQRLQVVIREDGGFSVQQGFNILKTFALCYFEMNLSPTDINFKQCKSSLLDHGLKIGHDWTEHLSWKYINTLKLKGFPEASLGLHSACSAVLS